MLRRNCHTCVVGKRSAGADCSLEKLNFTVLSREAGRDFWLSDERP
jgi:hypothetical protein